MELIVKDAVLAMVIIKIKHGDGNYSVGSHPIVGNTDMFNESDEVMDEAEDEIITVLPAPEGTFKVLGLFPDTDGSLDSGEYKELGYEFKGASNPDWKEIREGRVESERRRNTHPPKNTTQDKK